MRILVLALAASAAAQLVVPAIDFELHPQGGEHVYILPGSPECEQEAEKVCTSIIRKCGLWSGEECEVQCLAPSMPPLTKACLDTHPCAADVERLCRDVPRGQIMRCLHGQRAALTPACAHSDDCFAATTFSEDACGANPVGPHGGGSTRTRFHRGGLLSGLSLPWFGGGGAGSAGGDPQMLRHHAHPSHSLSEGACACLDECGDHLHDAVCDPCDPAAIGHHDGTGPDAGGWQAPATPHGSTAAAHGAGGHYQHSHQQQSQHHQHSQQQPQHHQHHSQQHQQQQQHGGVVSSVHQHGVPILQRPARHYAATRTHPPQHTQVSGEGQAGGEGQGEAVIPDASPRADDDDNPSGPEAAPGEPAPIPDDPAAASAEPAHAEGQGEAEGVAPAPAAAEPEYAAEEAPPPEEGVQQAEAEGYAAPVEHQIPSPPEHHLSGLGYVEGTPDEAAQQQHEEALAQAAAAEAGVEEVPYEGGGAERAAQPEAYAEQQAEAAPEAAASEAGAVDHAQAAAEQAAAEQAAAEQEAMAAELEEEDPAQEAAALLEVASAAGNAGGHGAPRKPAFVAGQHHGMLGRGGHGQRQQHQQQQQQHHQAHGRHAAAGHAAAAAAGGGHHTGSGDVHHGGHHAGGPQPPHKVCVRNPACGLKRHWCRVSPECKAPFVTIADVRGCHGPYHGHRHRGCEGALMARLADPENHPAPELPDHIHAALHERHAGVEALKRAAAAHIRAARHRCQLQEALSGAGEAHVCPRPTAAQWNAASSGPVEESSLTHIRTCEAPPPFLSFVRHFLDNVASAFGGQHAGQHGQAGHGGAHAGAAATAAAAAAAGRGFHVPTMAPSAHEAARRGHPPPAAAHHAPPAHGTGSGASSGSGVHAGVSSIHHPHAAAQQQQQHPAPAAHVRMPFGMGRRDDAAPLHRGGGQGDEASASAGWFGGAAVRALIGDASRELLWLYGVYVVAVLGAGSALLLCWCVVASRRRQIYGPGSHYSKGDASRIGIGAMCQALGRGCCCSRLCPSVFGTYQGSAGKLARLPALAAGAASAPQQAISGEALVQR
jgi:hypothetical protein